MYKHIMVPLDGSELAECVIAQLEMVAKSCQPAPKITLIRVVTPLRLYGGFEYGGVVEYISPEQIQRLEDDSKKNAQGLSCQTGEPFEKRWNQCRSSGYLWDGQSVLDEICGKKWDRPDYHCHARTFRNQRVVLGQCRRTSFKDIQDTGVNGTSEWLRA